MKLAILGGGGFRTPYVYNALLRDRSATVTEIALYDTDPVRLAAMTVTLRQLALEVPDASVALLPTDDLDTAVAGSAFVFAAIRVGGLAGRVADERVALGLNTLGQETTGPGGLAFGLRTIPVMRAIAARVAELAPDAWFINFTNPAGMITQALQEILGDRVLGICDTPSGLGRRLAELVGVPSAELQLDYVGLNHLGWLRRLLHRGEDLLPVVLASTGLESLEESQVLGPAWLRALGCIPNEYLYYYYHNADAVAAILASGQTRGEFLLAQQTAFYAAVSTDPSDAMGRWRRTVADREAGYMAEATGGRAAVTTDVLADQGYAGVALAVMNAIAHNEPATLILNVRNGSTIAGLPADAVVEVPTLVDGNGVHPLATAPPDLHQLGLMQQVKAVEELIISAAVTGSGRDALTGFALHPLVGSVSIAESLLAGYRSAFPAIDALLR